MVTDVMGSRFARDWLVVQFSQLYRGWGVKKNEAQRVIRKKEIVNITHCVLRTVFGQNTEKSIATYYQIVYIPDNYRQSLFYLLFRGLSSMPNANLMLAKV